LSTAQDRQDAAQDKQDRFKEQYRFREADVESKRHKKRRDVIAVRTSPYALVCSSTSEAMRAFEKRVDLM
jgi:hypothetical protein